LGFFFFFAVFLLFRNTNLTNLWKIYFSQIEDPFAKFSEIKVVRQWQQYVWHRNYFILYRGTPHGTRQAGNLIQSLIDDPDIDVAEILPSIPPSSTSSLVTITTPSLLTPMMTLSSTSPPSPLHKTLSDSSCSSQTTSGISLSRSLNTPTKLPNKIPTKRQISAPGNLVQQQPITNQSPRKKVSELPMPVDLELTPVRLKNVKSNSTVTTACSSNSSGWKSSQQLEGSSPRKKLTTTTKTTSHIIASQLTLVTTQQQQHTMNSIQTHHKIITTTSINTSVFSSTISRSLPKPIGSNRPFRSLTSPTNALSSTAVSNSVAATLHSTLNSLLSQVATQRSPMIWNDHAGSKEQLASGDLVVTTVATSPSNTLNGTPIERFLPVSLSHASSQESFKGHSRTPSLSPTSNHSVSPPPPEEKPHLNPIGSERGHKKPATHNQNSGLQGLPSLLQGKKRPSVKRILF